MALHSKESLTIWKRNANNICTTKSCWWMFVILTSFLVAQKYVHNLYFSKYHLSWKMGSIKSQIPFDLETFFKFTTSKQLIFAIMLWCLIMYTTLSLYCRNYKLCLDRKLALPYVCVRYFHRQFSMCLNNLLVVHVLIIPWNFTSNRYSRAPGKLFMTGIIVH